MMNAAITNDRIVRIAFCLILVALISAAPLAFAQEEQPGRLVPSECDDGDCGYGALIQLVRNIVTFLVWISVFVATVGFVIAGILYISAGGNEGQIGKAHRIMRNVLVGFLVVVSAWLIVYAITSTLLTDSYSGLESSA